MATTDITADYDIHYIKDVFRFFGEEIDIKTLFTLAKSGCIQRDRFVEKCMANGSNGLYSCISENGRDFCNDSDAKTVTVYYEKRKGKEYPLVKIKNVHRKKGALRVMAYDPKMDLNRYFYIWSYPKIKMLSFVVSGNSKYVNGEFGVELRSFEELAKYSH